MTNSAILLMGPTATGKTELALRLAHLRAIEIISVDSALIYRDMNIGSAKPSPEELSMVPHHLIDIMSPLDSYSVAGFIQDSVRLIHEINARGRLPVLVGGTMMYYNGLINGISKLPEADAAIRDKLYQEGISFGWEQLHQKLAAIDKKAALKIMPNDRQRIIRALEVFYLTGKPITTLQEEGKIRLSEGIDFLNLAILPSRREILHARINERFDKMLNQGLINEVESLYKKYPGLTIDHASQRSVGYYQVGQYLAGELNYTQLQEAGKAATRQLAKRQITWLRSMNIINLDSANDLEVGSLFRELLLQLDNYLPR